MINASRRTCARWVSKSIPQGNAGRRRERAAPRIACLKARNVPDVCDDEQAGTRSIAAAPGGAFRTARRAILKKPPTAHPPMPRPRRAPSPTAAARSNFSPPAATAAPEAIMLAHGFIVDQMVELVNAGLASVAAQRVVRAKT
jgi:hypothetical protein